LRSWPNTCERGTSSRSTHPSQASFAPEADAGDVLPGGSRVSRRRSDRSRGATPATVHRAGSEIRCCALPSWADLFEARESADGARALSGSLRNQSKRGSLPNGASSSQGRTVEPATRVRQNCSFKTQDREQRRRAVSGATAKRSFGFAQAG